MNRDDVLKYMRRQIAYAIKDIIWWRAQDEYNGKCGYCAAMTRKREYLKMYVLMRFGFTDDFMVHLNNTEDSISLEVLTGKYDDLPPMFGGEEIDYSAFL